MRFGVIMSYIYIYICIYIYIYVYIYIYWLTLHEQSWISSVVWPLGSIDALTCVVCLSWRKFVSKCWHHHLLIMSSAAVMFPSKTSIASLVLRRSKVWVCRWSTLLAAPHPRTWQGCQHEFTLCTPYHMLAVQSSKALEKPIATYKKTQFQKANC